MTDCLTGLERRVDEFSQLLAVVEEFDPKRVAAIIKAWRRHRGSIPALTQSFRLAGEGRYAPKGFTRRELDLGLLDLILGNLTLVYAHNHALGLPSITTIRSHCVMTRIRPNVGPISVDVIKANLENVFLPSLRDSDTHPSSYLSSASSSSTSLQCRLLANIHADGIKTLPNLDYDYATDSLLTTCFQHTKTAEELRMDSEAKVQSVIESLNASTIHMGSETTVVAVKVFGRRGVSPILLASGCSVLDTSATSNLMQSVLQAYQGSPSVLDRIQINAFVYDGASQWRYAGHQQFMKYKLSETFMPELWASVRRMRGFNAWVGPDGITQEFDYRHLWKRT